MAGYVAASTDASHSAKKSLCPQAIWYDRKAYYVVDAAT